MFQLGTSFVACVPSFVAKQMHGDSQAPHTLHTEVSLCCWTPGRLISVGDPFNAFVICLVKTAWARRCYKRFEKATSSGSILETFTACLSKVKDPKSIKAIGNLQVPQQLQQDEAPDPGKQEIELSCSFVRTAGSTQSWPFSRSKALLRLNRFLPLFQFWRAMACSCREEMSVLNYIKSQCTGCGR